MDYYEIPNHKCQIPNKLQLPKPKIQNSEYWNLRFFWKLVLDIYKFLFIRFEI